MTVVPGYARTTVRNTGLGLGSLALALTVTACGSGDPGDSTRDDGAAKAAAARKKFLDQSGFAIATQAVEAMAKVRSVRIKGDVTEDGDAISLDFTIDDTSGNCRGTFTQHGATAELVSLDAEQYMKADEAFWSALADNDAEGAQMATMFGGKWVKVPQSAEDFSELCDVDKLLGDFSKKPTKDDTITKGAVEKVGGEDAVVLTGDDDGDDVKVWVAVEGDHPIVKVKVAGDEPGSLEFLEIGEPADITAPPEDEVIDMTG